ncbi:MULTISPECIES: M48 family metallopeptidase [Oceanospirillaceae]|uniref:M48 family metallopeptidase n=1 Tax=Oceanospirillaceae TaxID=135620 RepID=UPI0016492D60|nr:MULTISPECIES: M48 family metallopeptidase [Thalassolituus]MCA6059432.1 M48 family metalloprotease [Thalassolituus sp. ST750PaO-4]MCB2385689.1 M48 family metallopeptidase [Thalassolituus alkanivorans]MCB2422787.1 M48 family metallopeptidase [Thalassolituus alkanivorans]
MNVEDAIRFQSDLSFFNELLADKKIQVLAEKRIKEARRDSYRRSLLGHSLRVTARLAPDLFKYVRNAQEALNLGDKNVEVYIYNSPEPNASCSYSGGDDIILTFSSGLLTSMNEDEINFVVGHELGHALFSHYALPTHAILEEGTLNASDAMKLMSWSRRAEISADRAGLFVCKSPEAAISSFLKLSCGVAHPIIEFDLKEYSAQIQDLSELSKNTEDTSHCYSSHPFNPIRIMAVDLYSQSDEFQRLTGQGTGNKTLADVDDGIHKVLEYMEPVSDEEKQALHNRAMFWGGAWVAYADGHLADAEAENLIEQAGEEIYREGIQLLEQAEDPIGLAREQFIESSKPLLSLGASNRCAFIQRLVVVARADQNIDDRELDALTEMAKIMNVEPSFVQQILMFLE